MLEVLKESYFIDLDEIEKYLELENTNDLVESGASETRINVVKFELVKLLLDVVLTEQMDVEDSLGLKNTQKNVSIPFKIAFNSLLNKKLINHY